MLGTARHLKVEGEMLYEAEEWQLIVKPSLSLCRKGIFQFKKAKHFAFFITYPMFFM